MNRILTEPTRAERRENERRLVAQAVDQLRSSEGWHAWLAARSRFHHYSVHNQLLISYQRPTATKVAGFKTWLGLGFSVCPGETAIRIWAPCPPTCRQIERWRESGGDRVTRPRTWFRLAAVFAQDQVQPLPPPATQLPLEAPIAAVEGDTLVHLFAPLKDVARRIGYSFALEALGGPKGVCDAQAHRISVEAGLEPNGQVAVAIHELAHALVRVDRRQSDPNLTYAQEELVVESIAWSVCGVLGVDTSASSIPYLAAWSQNTDLAILERTAQLVNRIANRIEDALPGIQRPESAIPVASP